MAITWLGNPCSPAARHAMAAGLIGCMITPAQGQLPPPGTICAIDNGKFGKGYPGDAEYMRFLASLPPLGALFAVAPDVPFDATGTLRLSPRFFDGIRSLGIPAGLAAQNGMEYMDIPWDSFDVVCLGGDTAWKTGPGGAALARLAVAHGKGLHMLRVNSATRLAYAAAIGCTSADGTFLTYAPDTNLPRVAAWYAHLDRTGIQGVLL